MPQIISNNSNLILQIKLDLLHARSVDLAVGQFFLPGFAVLMEEVAQLKKMRLLIGNNAERQDFNEVLGRQARLPAVKQAQEAERFAGQSEMRQRAAHLADSIRRMLANMIQSDNDIRTVQSLLRMLETGSLDIRAFVRERLESNLFLTEGEKHNGIAVYGNSNLFIHEINSDMNLNMRFESHEDSSQLRHQFEQWWNQALPFKDKMTRELQNSWVQQTTSPYMLYLLVLYHLVEDRLQSDIDDVEQSWIEGFPPLADFQHVAVQQALTILRQHNGVFIADVVGLGKTYIGTAILKRLQQQGQRATIFCPAALVPMWEEFNDRYGLSSIIVSTGKLLVENGVNLDEPKYQTADRQIVLIDESHRFRNRNTDRYRILNKYTEGRRCILLTATPYSLRPNDIYSQIRLFADDEIDLNLNPPRLNEFFRRIDDKQASLIDVLRPLLIRRTRKHIQKHYPDAVIAQEMRDGSSVPKLLTFPIREKPETIQYDVEGVYGGGLYDYIINRLGRPTQQQAGVVGMPEFKAGEMTYARYGLHAYVLPSYQNKAPYTDLKRAGYSVRGFIRILLFKRLESSVEAFRATVRILLTVHERFLTALANGYVPAGDQGQSLLYDQTWTDDAEMLEALGALNGRYDTKAFDMPRLERDLTNDRNALRDLADYLEPIKPDQDGKLMALRTLLDELNGQKSLIFTQYESTAEYLYNNLIDVPRIAWLSGRHRVAGKSFMEMLARFAPKANPLFIRKNSDPVNVLIATDVLSEGLNLQDCSLIINYDIHWNPVRLIQRIGRVDRIGSEAEKIRLYNFLPERNVEKVLNLEKVLQRRIAEIHAFIGEDNAILHPDEKLNDSDLYAAYTKVPEDDDGDPTSLAVDFTEIEELIRRLQRNSPEIIKALHDLPSGVRTAKQCSSSKDGAFLYVATEDFERLLLLDSHGNERIVSLEEILDAIECGDSEPALSLPPRYNFHISEATKRFELEAAQRQTDRQIGPKLTPGQRYALKHLAALLKEETNEEQRTSLHNLESALRTRLPDAALKELNTIRRLGLTGEFIRQRLLQAYRDLDLGRYIHRSDTSSSTPIARIICSEALSNHYV